MNKKIQKLRYKFLGIMVFILIMASFMHAKAQYIPVHKTNQVYDFLQELASEKLINESLLIKPLSRKEIYEILTSFDPFRLKYRQLKTLNFYLNDFNKENYPHKDFERRLDLLYYRDSAVSITINPIGGGKIWINENGTHNHWWNGAEAWGTFNNLGIYGSLRDNHESQQFTYPEYLNRNLGGANFKNVGDGKVDYWEFRGGITYDFGMGNIGLIKDHIEWGSNYHGANIFSGRAPSFAHLSFNLNPVHWLDFRFVHGWLVSEVVDSSRSFYSTGQAGSGTDFREVYHNKYMAANMITVRPVKHLNLSLGNSIIYDYDNPHPVYFIPLMFYKAVDHSLNSGIDNMNSQLFVNLSSNLVRRTHLYASLFIDELAVSRIFDDEEHNFYSFKGGLRLNNLFVYDTYAGAEVTITNALTYQHYVGTTTFESNRFNLGHYLEDNAQELYAYLGVKPIRNMDIRVAYNFARKGPDHNQLGSQRTTITPFEPIVWESEMIDISLKWQFINDGYLNVGFTLRDIEGEEEYLDRYTPEYFQGRTGTFTAGINYGF